MRRMNERHLLQTLREQGPMSRPALSKSTGLSKITVDLVAKELLNKAWLAEAAEPPTGSPGRRARLLSFRHDFAHVAAIDIGASRARIGVADLSGTFISQETADFTSADSGSEILRAIREATNRAVQASGLKKSDIRSLCVATPGIVDPTTMRVTLAPQLPGWDEINLVEEMSFIGDCPIHVENEVHLAVVAEQWRGAARGCDDVAYIHVGVGVGVGIVKNGVLIRGAHGGAGEIGYLPIGASSDSTRGIRGQFEWLVGGAAYERAAQTLFSSGRGTDLLSLAGGDPAKVDARLIYRAAESGDSEAFSIVDQILDYTAAGVASVSSVLDPELVILGGGISQAGTWMLDLLGRKLETLTPIHPRILLTRLGDDAVLIGATRRAIDTCERELFGLS